MKALKGFMVKNVHKLQKIYQYQIGPSYVPMASNGPLRSARDYKKDLDDSAMYDESFDTPRDP
jgi:hypothetical protein